jgi:hypothetical protein
MPRKKSVTKKVKEPKPTKTAAAPSLALDAPTASSQKRRQLSRSSTDSHVGRMLSSVHFKNLSPNALTDRTVDALTLRQTLAKLHRETPGSNRVSTLILAKVAATFVDAELSISALVADNPNTPAREDLAEVLAIVEVEKCNDIAQNSLSSFLVTCPALDERNLIWMLKVVLSNKLLARSGSEHLAVAIMEYMIKCTASKSTATQTTHNNTNIHIRRLSRLG